MKMCVLLTYVIWFMIYMLNSYSVSYLFFFQILISMAMVSLAFCRHFHGLISSSGDESEALVVMKVKRDGFTVDIG